MKPKEMYLLGLSHYNLNTPHKNTSLAIEKFETAAKLGYGDAYYFLGRFYGLGDGVSLDMEKAFTLYERGLEIGSDKCGYAMGLAYHGGIGVKKDAETATYYFKTHYEMLLHEANANDSVSMYLLGTYYYYGFSVNRYMLKAIEWFKKAADIGYADAQYMLGMVYETLAEDHDKNRTQAAHYYELAAKQDHPYALYALGINALEKKAWPIAIHYLERAAHQHYALAAYSLAMYFHEKEEKTPIKAYEWFLVAAKQNHIMACYYTGLYHQYGKGVKKDIGLAVFWYEKAAHQNEKNALYHLAMILVKQPGSNKKDVFKLLEKAALQDHHHAQYNLAVMYHKGDGVESDIHLAFEWYKKAAEAGLPIAQYNLGMLYFEGKAVPKDENQAKYWWQKAADQGLEAAVKLMLSINNYDKLQKSTWQ